MRNVVAIAAVALVAAGCVGRARPMGPTDLPPHDSASVPAGMQGETADTVRVVEPPAPPLQPRELDPLPLPEGVRADDFDISLEYNRRVDYWLKYYQRYRETFAAWLERMSRYEPLIRRELTDAGLPGDLIYLGLIESGFTPGAVSSAHAVGIWQLMGETARDEGLEISTYIDERRDPIKATAAAVHHLRSLYKELGSWYLVAAAYNSGSGRVGRALDASAGGARGADSLFWRIEPVLPSETRDYVPKLLAASILAKYPDRFGIAPGPLPGPDDVDVVHIERATDLAAIARAARTDESAIRRLNAQFYLGVTPPGRRVAVRVPAGHARGLLARLADMPRRERVHDLHYTAGAGDTPKAVAERYGVSLATLRKANHLKKKTKVFAEGRELVIPLAGSTVVLAQGSSKAARPVEERKLASDAAAKRVAADTAANDRPPARAAEADADGYVVRPGDTLADIADAHGLTVARLRELNGLTRASIIQPGQKLRLAERVAVSGDAAPARAHASARKDAETRNAGAPARTHASAPDDVLRSADAPASREARADDAATARRAPARAEGSADSYVVRPGDTLADIADAHGLTVGGLRELNGLTRTSVIQPGQKLRLSRARVVIYRVHHGDTLYGIARKHGVSVQNLRDWNGLASDAVIHAGDEVDIHVQGESQR